ncbi:hypothetical protein Y71_15020 [Kosakonia radicincitans DSM 16656]|nr:hypothetical protein Y71_15020 [Kosakonia radicincitans DSM 16656]
MIQYSVTEGWKNKVRETLKRLRETRPNTQILIYLTNQEIGAKADDLKIAARKSGISLDVRDKNWFLERVLGNDAREKAAEELAILKVDPLLASKGLTDKKSSELSQDEAVTAATFLALQWQDDNRDKGLTKLAFEALVRASLIDTDTENRMKRCDIHSKIHQFLPSHPAEVVSKYIDSALRRLTKKTIKHWESLDEFCLAHEEIVRYKEFRARSILSESTLLEAMRHIMDNIKSMYKSIPIENEDLIIKTLRNISQKVLLERSQAFALAVQSGSLSELADNDFTTVIINELNDVKLPRIKELDWIQVMRTGVRMILTSNNGVIQEYLRSLSDSFTLLAFLKKTPDVQKVVEKMFSTGNIWLDTTIVLPLIADTLLDEYDSDVGRFTRMIDAARDVGFKLYVTPGVVEEIERHMNRAKTCAQMINGKWQGSVPFLLERFIVSGRSRASFAQWLENFRGDVRPLEDISIYLSEVFKINIRSLEDESQNASHELRHALEQIWGERYKHRQEKYGAVLDDMAVARLIAHDVECYSGVIGLRNKQASSPFGYNEWWLTVDKQAFDLKEKLKTRMSDRVPDSPVMSADFMVNYLAFGPSRRKVDKNKESHLPVLMIMGNTSYLTPELLKEAERLREQYSEMPERIIRRHVRDYLDGAKSKIGPVSHLGLNGKELDEIDESLQLASPSINVIDKQFYNSNSKI